MCLFFQMKHIFQGVHAEENLQKKRVKRTVQIASRPIGDVTVEALLAKRNQKPEFRRAQREQAIKAAKDAVRQQKTERRTQNKAKQVRLFYIGLFTSVLLQGQRFFNR